MQVPGKGHGLLGSHGSGPFSGVQDDVDASADWGVCLGVRNGMPGGQPKVSATRSHSVFTVSVRSKYDFGS